MINGIGNEYVEMIKAQFMHLFFVHCISNIDFITYISLSNKVIIHVHCEIHRPKKRQKGSLNMFGI